MTEGAAVSSEQEQNGRQGSAPTALSGGTLSGPGELPGFPSVRAEGRGDAFGGDEEQKREGGTGQSDPGRPRRGLGAPYAGGQWEREPVPGGAGALSLDPRHAEDVLSRARSHAESLGAQARADAEELLSRAQSQAELLRVHADAIRAEAERLRAETAAMRSRASPDPHAGTSPAEAMAAQARAAAEDFRSVLQLEVDAARKEFERMTTEAMLVRRVLRAEIDAGLVDVDRMRGDVQRLCAETEKLAAELRLLFAAGALDHMGVAGEPEGRSTEAPRSDEPGRTRPTVAHAEADPFQSSGDPVAGSPSPGAEDRPGQDVGEQVETNLAELLRQIWDAASTGLGRLPENPPSGALGRIGDDPTATPAAGPFPTRDHEPGDLRAQGSVDQRSTDDQIIGTADGRRGSEPLIGSGGWRARQAAPSDPAPEAGEATAPPPPGRRRRRFNRG